MKPISFGKRQALGSNPNVGPPVSDRSLGGRACETLAAGNDFGANLGIEEIGAPRR
jgi:hypothetical protein